MNERKRRIVQIDRKTLIGLSYLDKPLPVWPARAVQLKRLVISKNILVDFRINKI
jgi:hypothetical protein